MIVAPPDFAPAVENVITLYDVVYKMMAGFDPSLKVSAATPVSFTEHIYPVFRRVSRMHWASDDAARGHGPDKHAFFLARLDELSSNKAEHQPARMHIFGKLRNPAGGGGDMPKLPASTKEGETVALPDVQYSRMRRWAEGTFDADWPGQPPVPLTLEQMPARDRPQALDRAALEACVGGGFFPGIEVGRIMLEESTYDKKRPFRINAELAPGTLTAKMAVPWQADFFYCTFENGADWWPGQRPNQVFRGRKENPGCRTTGRSRSAWCRLAQSRSRGRPWLPGWQVEFVLDGQQCRLQSSFLVHATGRAPLADHAHGTTRIFYDRLVGLISFFSGRKLERART